jgi:catechol 2,3-dioxygenase-like lactoylglutathione lyase family enzyme
MLQFFHERWYIGVLKQVPMKRYQVLLTFAVLFAAPVLAQLAPPNAAGVTMGHVHLAVTDVDAQKQFWISVMGGTLVKNGPLELIQFPGVFIMLRKAEKPAPPPAGSVVNHFGFVVKDMPGALAKWKAANIKIEPTENPNEAYAVGPDGIRVEVYGVPDLPTPVQMNHIHYASPDIPAMQAWYAKTFGATPGTRACVACVSKPRTIETGNLPGMNLSFAQGDKSVAPTKGRSLDHIGFEVKNLEAFIKNLEAQGIKMDVPMRQVPNSKTKIAFLTDPWGTYIELTEGLAP